MDETADVRYSDAVEDDACLITGLLHDRKTLLGLFVMQVVMLLAGLRGHVETLQDLRKPGRACLTGFRYEYGQQHRGEEVANDMTPIGH